MEPLKPYVIAIRDNMGNLHSSVINGESTVEDLLDTFMGLMITSGFHQESINRDILERADELNNESN